MGMSRPERLVVGVVMAAALMGTPRTAVAQLQLDVMTFNIRTSNVSDGDNGWPHRKKLVAETIRRYAPQVVGLQEAVDEQIEFLTAALPDYRWLGIDRGLNGGQGLSEYTPIFYRHAEMTPIESGNFWLSETPDVPPVPRGESGRRGRGGRIVTWARFHHLTTGQAVYVFNTHFTLRRGQRQLDSVRLILERVGALPPRSAVVVMGDFNNVGGERRLAGRDRRWTQRCLGGGRRAAWAGVDAERLRSAGGRRRRTCRLDPRRWSDRRHVGRDRPSQRRRPLPVRPLPGRGASRDRLGRQAASNT